MKSIKNLPICRKKSVPNRTLTDNSNFNKAHIINKPTNKSNKQQQQKQRSPDKTATKKNKTTKQKTTLTATTTTRAEKD